jgi:cytochrome oxidase Cu insertion factor (SCO1/SenC/PrrC family)
MSHPKHPHHPHPHTETRKQILTKLRLFQIALAVVCGLFLAVGATVWQTSQDESRRLEMREAAMHPNSQTIGGPFTLTDQDGKTAHDTDFRGKYLLIYFGYTYCPDLCPTGLDGITHALTQLGPDARKVQPIFITIDPARDTPEKLKEYVANFNPDIVALTGTPDQIATVAREYQVYYAKGETVEDGQYLMDHSNLIYVMDPQGKFVTTFPDDMDPTGMVEALRTLWKSKAAGKARIAP